MPAAPQKPANEQSRRDADRSAEGMSRGYGDALRAADGAAAERVALEGLQKGLGVEALYDRVIAPAMWRIGCLWEEGAITVADEHLATALTHRVMASVYGASFGRTSSRPGRILLAAVEGQRHAVGLRMAADVLELGGYEIHYLGGDVPLDALSSAIGSREPDLVGLSSTLTTDVSSLETAVSELREAFAEIPILLGGQGIPDEILRDGQVIRVAGTEGLVSEVEALLDGITGASTPESPPSADPLPQAGSDSPEGLLLGAAADTADLARTHARLAHSYRRLAYEDPITKGPNRRAFDERLSSLADSPEASRVAILILDLDGFKQVNDKFGHATGDAVLRKVFEAIESSHRDGDFAARLGGDEFASLLPHTEIAEAERVAGRILAATRAIDGEAPLTATIGLAPLHGGPRRAMLEADLALYRAKEAGGNSIGVADPD
jgi:diguanylate cyclase (GGDEF)-like protein